MARDLISERLKALNESKEDLKQDNKQNVMQTIATGEDEKPDFERFAASLDAQAESVEITGTERKDTIYIREDLFRAMNAYVKYTGKTKKHIVNEMYEQYLEKAYRELREELPDVQPTGEEVRLKAPRKSKND